MAYYNRKPQLVETLSSLTIGRNGSSEEYEIVIVDDGSDKDHRLEDLIEEKEHYPITLVRIEPEEKSWVNPCMAYNKAISLAKGDKVIIQNPECKYKGSILNYVSQMKKYQYVAFSCLSWDQTQFSDEEALSINYSAGAQCAKGWYHHPIYNNRPYHFCCALHKENLDKLKGFDERFKDGPCYDDDDFVRRVQKLGLQIVSPTDPYVIHQWHDSGHIFQADSHQRFLHNQKIYGSILSGELPSWS